MLKRLTLLKLLIIFYLFNLEAQGKYSNILFTTNGNDLFLPLIENNLKKLQTSDENLPLIGNLTYLERILSNRNLEVEIRKAILYYDNEIFFSPNSKSDSIRSSISKLLVKNDYFLEIKFAETKNIIEIQFYLFEIIQSVLNNQSFPIVDISNPISVSSISINASIDDLSKLNNLIERGVKKVFPMANYNPVAIIGIKNYDAEEEHVQKLNSQLVIHGDFSYDLDDSKNELIYFWEQIFFDKSPLETSKNSLSFSTDGSKCIIDCNRPGIFYLSLTVSDNIETSNKDTIKIIVSDTPKIKLSDNTIFSRKILGLFGNSKKDTLVSSVAIFTSNFKNVDPQNIKIRIHKEKIDTFSLLKKSYLSIGSGETRWYFNLPIGLYNYKHRKIEEGIETSFFYSRKMKDKKLYVLWKKGNLVSNEEVLTIKNRRIFPFSIGVEYVYSKYENFFFDSTKLDSDTSTTIFNAMGLSLSVNITSKIQAEMVTYANISSNDLESRFNFESIFSHYTLRLGTMPDFFNKKNSLNVLGFYYSRLKYEDISFLEDDFTDIIEYGIYAKIMCPILPDLFINFYTHYPLENFLNDYEKESVNLDRYRIGLTYFLSF